ncbi:hypothetical protein [Pseudosulfitobacter pseudonitzschiae]|uniref:hypothetical protein n=1 Tax=Pseudosulfitobacter pseudonitzschiae TaxID=1402135 RepID=UPI0037CC6D17
MPWGPLNSLVETLDDPHVRARQLLRTVAHDSGKTETFLVQPLKFNDFVSGISAFRPSLALTMTACSRADPTKVARPHSALAGKGIPPFTG